MALINNRNFLNFWISNHVVSTAYYAAGVAKLNGVSSAYDNFQALGNGK
jgi:hypothetical protein